MARHYAISIGINHYCYYPERPLRCAENDATEMQAFLSEVGFQDVFLYSDGSPAIETQSTQPERTNLLRALGRISSRRFLKPEDSFWFFFSGHGARRAGFDYLLPSDGDPENLADTAIPIDRVIRSLRECGAGNLVLILDACRNQVPELSKDMGSQTKELAKQEGVITLFSCSPGERSYELPDRQQGAFTFALLEALRGECHPGSANAKQLNEYLQNRVPALAQALGKQTPYLVAEPYEKGIQLLLPSSTSPPLVEAPPTPNLDRLEADIYRAIYEDKDLVQAKLLWDQFNQFAATPEERAKAGEMLLKITAPHLPLHSKEENISVSDPSQLSESNGFDRRRFIQTTGQTVAALVGGGLIVFARQKLGDASPPTVRAETEKEKGSTVEFSVVKVDATGHVIDNQRKNAELQAVDLGSGVALELMAIPQGLFMMGSPTSEEGRYDNESPQHSVTIKPFWMGKYPVSQAQWRAVAGLPKVSRDLTVDPARFKGLNLPVEQVTWDDATEFCARLSNKMGQEYRLPSESEWEYACRANTTTPFYFGETITPDLVNYDGNYTYGGAPKGVYRQKTTNVGSFPPNAFGLYDMHGNVWEWCQDIWHDNYAGAPTDGTAWVEGGDRTLKVLRGGSWDGNPGYCRSAVRSRNSADYGYINIGFRVVCSLARTLS